MKALAPDPLAPSASSRRCGAAPGSGPWIRETNAKKKFDLGGPREGHMGREGEKSGEGAHLVFLLCVLQK